ncbi:MAG: 6-phosphogluconolactonase [Polyangia bacterium]
MNAPNAPRGLSGRLVIEASPEAVAQRLADDLVLSLRQRIGQAGTVHLALSGGSTPQGLYQLLATDARYTTNDWAQTHLWLVDERCVPDDDPRLNFAMIRSALADRVPLPPAQVHPMPVDLADGDRCYENDLRRSLVDRRLDAAVLGMGPDGHTASLFPYSPALDERQRWVRFNDGERVLAPRPRMTMTYPVLCATRLIAVLVTGGSKHAALLAAAEAPDNLHAHPIVGIRPVQNSKLVWYLDRAAADGLT